MNDMMGSRHCIWRFIPRVRVGKGQRPMEGNRHWRKRIARMARMDRERDCDGRYCIAEQASLDRWLFGHLANLQRSIVALNPSRTGSALSVGFTSSARQEAI